MFALIFILILVRIFYINLYKKNYYKTELTKIDNTYTYGLSAPRGRILDSNGNILVDNVKKRVIIYNKSNLSSIANELSSSKILSKYLPDNVNITDEEKAAYIFSKTNNIKSFLSNEEYQKYEKQIYSYNDVKDIAIKYIKENLIEDLNQEEVKIAKIYSLMNKDYYYDKKIIFDNIDDETYFKIIGENISGISGEYIYERVYPYNDLLKSILGTTGKIDKKNKEEYINKGYMLSDIVGTSFLEKEYEDILKGKKAKYLILKNGTLKKIEDEEKGNDITLNIDINIQSKLDEIMRKYIKETKGKINTDYYNGSYVLIGKPTGEIVAALGLKLDEKGNFYDVTHEIISSSFVPGSVVKAASNTVSYHEGVISPGKKIKDSCVKLYMNTIKCSYKSLGYVDDITALEKSSNYYQFINALKVMGYDYKYNMKATASVSDFNKYRDIFKSYGLGSKTEIDLPDEKLGITGSIVAPDLLLNLSIGQYDAYTPVQLLSYVNTLATKGKRYNLSFLQKENNIIDSIDITGENMDRIQTGLNQVVTKGTARNYMVNRDGAGKTGTSETLVDANHDGIYETKTISTSFIGYAPFNNPKYTFVVISPNISSNKYKNNYYVPINYYIMHSLTQFLFEN